MLLNQFISHLGIRASWIVVVNILATLFIAGCQTSPSKEDEKPLITEEQRRLIDENLKPYQPDSDIRAATLTALEDVHRRNPWITKMPYELKFLLRECFRERLRVESGFSLEDASAQATARRVALVASYYDALAAHQFADFDPYCKELVDTATPYVP